MNEDIICLNTFDANAPFWHICTDGTQMQDFLFNMQDYSDAQNILAAARCRHESIEILTFQLMSNHVHLILRGTKTDSVSFFNDFSLSLRRVFNQKGKAIKWSSFKSEVYPIPSLEALRNEILYVNRNAYVVHKEYTPYTYPWGGGIAIFNPLIKHLESFCDKPISILKKRELLHCREVGAYDRLKFDKGIAIVTTFCNIPLAESIFANARDYYNSLYRNAESFGQIAQRLRDSIVMTDGELFRIAAKISNERYGGTKVNLLSPEQKIDIAKELHYKYKAGNQQLRRMLRLDLNYLNEIFPNSSSPRHP